MPTTFRGAALRVSSRPLRLVLALAVLAAVPFAARPSAAAVEWRDGTRSAPAPMGRPALEAALARLGPQRVVVHFAGPLPRGGREALEASGVRLLSYLGGHAYFAALGPALDAPRAAALPGWVAVEPIAPARKLHPDLAAGIVRPWSVIAGGDPTKPVPADPTVAVYVLFHRDFDAGREAAAVLQRHGARLRSHVRAVNGVVAHLPMSAVAGLAAEDAVMYVEPPLPALEPVNDSNRARVGADVLAAPPFGLDGAGVKVLVYDGGRVASHGDLAGRLTIGTSDTSGVSDHSTHVACTVAGDGANSGGQFRGMAPAAEIVSYGFEQEGGLSQGFLYTDPGDLEADYTEAISVFGADLSNNSIGTNTAANGFPCSWEGNYGVTGALIDEIVRGATGAPFRVVWANGNERGPGSCGSTYHTTAPPACAKNHITVGALNSDNDTVTSFTSWGPCDDDRLKPDVSAPGCQSGGDNGVTSCSSSGGYNVKCGTSMASPTTAGVTTLLLQQYRQTFPGDPDPRNSTMKAILAQTAVDLITPGPDFQTGYGSIRGVPAAELIADERFVEAEVSQGETYSFLVLVGAGDTELKVTLAWDDPAGTPDVNPVLVNDLDLRVIDPAAGTHLPWTLDPANPSAPAVRTQRDGVNNIEQVVIDNPAPGAYRVEVVGFDIADGPLQPFSAAASPSLINCAPAGFVSTDRARISCNADLGVQVVDCDLNTDDGVVETVGVTVASDSEPGGESLLLTETAAPSAAFAGSIPVDTVDAAGVVMVADGDTISVTYVDADDGAGGIDVPVTRDVAVDCTSPTITGVTLTEVNPRDATVAVTADEPVRLTVSYATACGAPGSVASSFTLAAAHEVRLTGLTDDTTYFFSVEAEDEAGNVAVADNGGACYSFTTPEVPDFFTEQFGAGIDLVGTTVTFEPNGSIDFYSACAEELDGALPTDPAGGITLTLGDDEPTSFILSAASVSLYGQSYTTIFVGPNGYLTFGAGDSTYTESLAAHFSLPRVAAVFDDLNPGAGGTVSRKQLADRVAVTWEGVPEYSTSNSNTFQIEMFFDGRIRLSWLQLDTADAIVGLSEGQGLDPAFLESDLSSDGACGPRPPAVLDLDVATTIGDPLDVVLVALDDGLPAPPALTYRVASLPAFGTLVDDGTGQVITAVPHDLAGGGNGVTYQPYPGYGGPDSFLYRADDGGAPPQGGESDDATVAISVAPGAPEVVHAFLTDDVDPGWSTTGDWAFGPPAGGGSHAGDPTSGATGSNVYGYNLQGDYANGMGEEYLTTAPIDLSWVTGVEIEFQRWLGVDGSLQDHARLDVRTGQTGWTPVWIHTGLPVDESAWGLQSYDVSAVADREAGVQFRWVMGTTNGASTYPGWNIDDVRIRGVVVATCSTAPKEVSDLTIAPDRQTITWSLAPQLGQGSPVFDTVRSDDAADFVGAATCVETDEGSDTSAVDPQVPPAGGVYYYLVRAENRCGPGPVGSTSAGSGRNVMECGPGR